MLCYFQQEWKKLFQMCYTFLTKGTRTHGRKLLSLYFLKYFAYIKIFKIKCQDLTETYIPWLSRICRADDKVI